MNANEQRSHVTVLQTLLLATETCKMPIPGDRGDAAKALRAAIAALTPAPEGGECDAVAVIEKVGDRYGNHFTHVDATLRVYNGYVPEVGDNFYTVGSDEWRSAAAPPVGRDAAEKSAVAPVAWLVTWLGSRLKPQSRAFVEDGHHVDVEN